MSLCDDGYKRSLMTLDQLRTFCRVARRLSFTAAASDLHFTQSAVSQQIRALEQTVKARLFDRSGNHLSLTSAGEQLLASAERMLQEFDDVLASLQAPQ